jgi:hypothetical protein
MDTSRGSEMAFENSTIGTSRLGRLGNISDYSNPKFEED